LTGRDGGHTDDMPELRNIDPTDLFDDGFESGDVSAWSAAVP
jgi:hypothetical protein